MSSEGNTPLERRGQDVGQGRWHGLSRADRHRRVPGAQGSVRLRPRCDQRLPRRGSLTVNRILFGSSNKTVYTLIAKNCALLKEAVMDFIVENGIEVSKKISVGNVPGHLMNDLLTAVNRKGMVASNGRSDTQLSTMQISDLLRSFITRV